MCIWNISKSRLDIQSRFRTLSLKCHSVYEIVGIKRSHTSGEVGSIETDGEMAVKLLNLDFVNWGKGFKTAVIHSGSYRFLDPHA
ncbi:hypothetical protein L1887_15081 [Cichorium endivia]|nr:hypothetical protein L1887_15081 [Cichorium endivia]